MIFESLPNEIYLELFQYFSSRELFHQFYNLNNRFNVLLQSLYSLSLLLKTPPRSIELYFPFIRHLIIDRAVNVDLHLFPRLRHLSLRYPTDSTLEQINQIILPQVEHLSINHMHRVLLHWIPRLCSLIFSNALPRLISCELFEWSIIESISSWTQLPSLRCLKTGQIDLLIYQNILSSCPNLHSLQFSTITANHRQTLITFLHENLKKLTIKTVAFVPLWNESVLDQCLSYVPRLQSFVLHRSDTMSRFDFERLISIVDQRLIYLHRWEFYLHFFHVELILEPNILQRMKERFQNLHSNRYQARLIIQQSSLS